MAVNFAIDFDSAYTNIYMIGSGLVLSEPSVCAVSNLEKGEIKAFGAEAKKLIGKTSKNTKIIFPVFDGEIVNEKVAKSLLNCFLDKVVGRNKSLNSGVVYNVPCGVTSEMAEKYFSLLKGCGFSHIHFVETPILAALGQRIPLSDSTPCFIIDMGSSVTNIAAASLDGVIAGLSVNIGASNIDTEIIDYVSDVYGIQIGLLSAERLRKEIGSLDEGDTLSTVVNGRDLKTGSPKAITIKANEIYEPVKKYYDKVFDIALSVITKLPPEVSAEIRHVGLYVSGVASTLYGLKNYFEKLFEIQVNLSEVSEYAVVLGGGILAGNVDLLKKLQVKF